MTPTEMAALDLRRYFAEEFGKLAADYAELSLIGGDPHKQGMLEERAYWMACKAAHEAFRACPDLRVAP